MISAGLKDKNGSTLRIVRQAGKTISPTLTLTQNGEVKMEEKMKFGWSGVCDTPVMLADGTYTAKVELDMGPYLGKVTGEKNIQIKK